MKQIAILDSSLETVTLTDLPSPPTEMHASLESRIELCFKSGNKRELYVPRKQAQDYYRKACQALGNTNITELEIH